MEENDFVLKKEGATLQVYLGFELSMANSTTLRDKQGRWFLANVGFKL